MEKGPSIWVPLFVVGGLIGGRAMVERCPNHSAQELREWVEGLGLTSRVFPPSRHNSSYNPVIPSKTR